MDVDGFVVRKLLKLSSLNVSSLFIRTWLKYLAPEMSSNSLIFNIILQYLETYRVGLVNISSFKMCSYLVYLFHKRI